MRPAPLVLTFLISATLAGCLGDSGDEIDPPASLLPVDVEEYALERLIQGHDHEEDHQVHAGRVGFETLAFATVADPVPGEGFGELVVKGDYAYVATSASGGFVDPEGTGGFAIFDVSNASAPEHVGRWLGQPLGDLEVSDDGAFAFAATQRNGYPYSWALDVPLGGMAPRGISIVSLTDGLERPPTVGFAPLPPNGPHTITYFQHPDGRELIFAQTYDILFTAYPDNLGQNTATQKVVIYEFVRAAAPHLVPLSYFQILEPDEGALQFLPHDATAHVDPGTGQVILDIAYWDKGLVMVDITDPESPRELSRFADTAPSSLISSHLARVFPGTIDNMTVAVLEPEIPTGDDTGAIVFVDVSDPTAPRKLDAWMLPGELVVDIPFKFSPHNFDLVCGGNGQATGMAIDYGTPCEDPTVLLTHNHAGLWALDASDPTNVTATGFFYPEAVDGGPVPSGFGTVFVQGGLVFAPEYRTGLYVLELTDPVAWWESA